MPKKRSKKSLPAEPLNKALKTEPVVVQGHTPVNSSSFSSNRVRNIVTIVLIILLVIAFKFKNLIIVASVNGKPITRWQLEQELNSKYGAQTLDNLVGEQIILSEAHKKGVFVSDAEIASKIQEIENRIKGKILLDDALKSQGLNRDSFRKQVEIQLTIDKMFDKEASVSDKDVNDYIEQNQASFSQATDTAKLKSDVYQNLRQQKIGDLFDKWFAGAKKDAKVVKY